jgi:hypothetical protein
MLAVLLSMTIFSGFIRNDLGLHACLPQHLTGVSQGHHNIPSFADDRKHQGVLAAKVLPNPLRYCTFLDMFRAGCHRTRNDCNSAP